MFRPTPKKFLAMKLESLFASAQAKPGQRYATKLTGGLHIAMQVTKPPDRVWLQLRRETVCPSMQEWYTTLENMPWPCKQTPQVMPDGLTLQAAIPISAKML